MIRTLSGYFAGLVLSMGAAGAFAQPPEKPVDPQMARFKVVAKAADDCARICNTCSVHCARIAASGEAHHLITLRHCLDCADICSTTSSVVSRDGPLADLMCTACAEACKRCGEACQKHGNDPIMKACAAECFKCEKECRELLKVPAPGK